MRAGFATAAAVLAVLATTDTARPDPPGSLPARAAVRLCRQADAAEPGERRRLWSQGLAIAEHAVARHPHDPVAHFAVFCNLGKRASADGIGPDALAAVPRLREHIERALQLAPDWAEALAARGAFVAALPGILGGDTEEGERLIRRSLAIDPGNAAARRELARMLRKQGRDAEAAAALAPAGAQAAAGGAAQP